jgi:hypothetical protein
LTDDPTCERCLGKDESATHPMWLWGHSLYKISSPGPVLYGTKWLLWHPLKQSPTFHSKYRINKGLIKKGKHNRSLKVTVQGPDYYGPSFMHSFILSTWKVFIHILFCILLELGKILILPKHWLSLCIVLMNLGKLMVLQHVEVCGTHYSVFSKNHWTMKVASA